MLFKFIPEVETFIRRESDRTGKTLVRVVEDVVLAHGKIKRAA